MDNQNSDNLTNQHNQNRPLGGGYIHKLLESESIIERVDNNGADQRVNLDKSVLQIPRNSSLYMHK